MSDRIRLTVPREREYYGVARLVLGGLAARFDISYESLEDLQVALETVLGTDSYAAEDEVTVELTMTPGSVEVLLGPLDAAKVESDLEREVEESEGIGLRRLLDTVVENARLEQLDGGSWLRLEKRIPGVAEAGGAAR